jgi:hypothetical protein
MIPVELIHSLNVVHHVKGRIRFRLLPDALNHVSKIDVHEITSFIRSVSGIEDVRINLIAASLIIYYNPQKIQPKLWERLSHANNSELPQILALLTPQFQN